ncbi:phosphatase PAP2 family protein [Deefgea tanakiae]|uniref:Phosphatase PAP2 family protein n=1 Tax=Deefgea tanakiae TaxID=2865840 RepID=A0ABX8Z3T6_9NEIS|nr:phosphatase PAP2 family protein [Deefgea tanakiae]QZA77244.1 phosphatase PAP2 family protein [Deefgea tanakiae]
MRDLRWWNYVAPAIFGCFLLWVYPKTNWDHALIAPYFDPELHFFWRDQLFLSTVMHDGLKIALQLIGLASFFYWLYAKKINSPEQRRCLWLWIGIVFSTLSVSFLKRFSVHACPWDLTLYGGFAAELPLFANLPSSTQPGRCFPGGHASGGYALLTIYFTYIGSNTRLAYWGLGLGLLFGTAMGWTQMMRGAHFLSHNLWTLLTVWCVLLLWYSVWPPVAKRSLAHA